MNDFNKNKKRKYNKRKKKKRIALVLFTIFSVALFVGLSLTVFFPVKNVTSTGSKIYNGKQIVKLSGIKLGDNVLRLNKNDVLDKIQKELLFVDDIIIDRNLDGNIVIKVKDAKELFVYKCDDKYFSTDKNGRILKSYDELPDSVLHILCEAKLSEDKTRIIIDEPEKSEVINMVSTKIEDFALTVNYLDITNSYEIKMLFDNRLTVNFGDISYFEEKLAHFLKMTKEEALSNVSGTVNLSQYSPENPSAFFVKQEKNQ